VHTSGTMQVPHITVCICTLRRPKLLAQLLERLESQQTVNSFTYSVVVADNDSMRSAEEVVAEFSSRTNVPVRYCVEPLQNISLARNQAVEHVQGDLIAFIDDDEFPAGDWLRNLFDVLVSYSADAVLGPVKPHFESDVPAWMKKGKFFERPTHPTGFRVSWKEARTGNVLFRRSMLAGVDVPFKPEFGLGGEDVDFFRRMAEKGFAFFWCNEAVVYEVVPPSRCRLSYLLNRALLRGSNFSNHPTHRFRNAAKSLFAVPCYTLALPVLALVGPQWFVRYLIKLLDHASRLLAFLGLKLVTRREI
jgi:succinoglycan biosynthesis protein ExoM